MSGPPPPADLAGRTPHVLTLDAGTRLHRFFTLADGHTRFDPIFYDRSRQGRFNAPDGGYGVLYAAHRPEGAFAEAFLRTAGRRMLDAALIARKGYVVLEVIRPLTVIHFDGPHLAPLGATAALPHSDPPYDVQQAWSQALRAHPSQPTGIAYSARHDPHELCYALFEPTDSMVKVQGRDDRLAGSDWFWRLADHYEVGLAPGP